MKYEVGLSRLRRYLARIQDEESLKRLAALEARLDAQREKLSSFHETDFQNLLQELDKLAYRTAGASFTQLCADVSSEHRRPLIRQSLLHVLQILFVLLLLPGIGLAFASRNAQVSDLEKYAQIERKTQMIDTRIASGILGPFYLSFLTPCSPTALQRLVETDIRVEWSGPDCTWSYIDPVSGLPFAQDQWADEGIAVREYYEKGLLIARDVFDPSDKVCFKRRSYFTESGEIFGEKCFSEAGVALDPKFRELRSPIPPPFYWFWLSYR